MNDPLADRIRRARPAGPQAGDGLSPRALEDFEAITGRPFDSHRKSGRPQDAPRTPLRRLIAHPALSAAAAIALLAGAGALVVNLDGEVQTAAPIDLGKPESGPESSTPHAALRTVANSADLVAIVEPRSPGDAGDDPSLRLTLVEPLAGDPGTGTDLYVARPDDPALLAALNGSTPGPLVVFLAEGESADRYRLVDSPLAVLRIEGGRLTAETPGEGAEESTATLDDLRELL